jgi:hypothetical protein
MKYKLLTEKGTHFVCLEDGTRIPLQTNTSISQYCRDMPIGNVEAMFGPMFQGPKLEFDGANLSLNSVTLDSLLSLDVDMYADENKPWIAKFSVYVELVDTVELPKKP